MIENKREDINEHEIEKADDKSKFMKDLREDEIKHDGKVIERKEKAAEKHEAKIKENEQEINK